MVFTSAFFGAALPYDRPEIAQMLVAILNSSLASWFFLMTASTFGLGRRRVLLRDIEHIPVPNLTTSSHSEAGQRLVRVSRSLERRPPDRDESDWRALDEAVFDLYDLHTADRIVARDGLLRSRWQWKEGRLLSATSADIERHVVTYADVFMRTIDTWLSAGKRRRMRGEVFDLPSVAPLRVVRFVLEEGIGPSVAEVIRPDGSLRELLDRIGKRLDVQLGTALVGQRSLRVYGPDEVVIIKPAAYRHWMEVSALEDADAVIADSVSGTIE